MKKNEKQAVIALVVIAIAVGFWINGGVGIPFSFGFSTNVLSCTSSSCTGVVTVPLTCFDNNSMIDFNYYNTQGATSANLANPVVSCDGSCPDGMSMSVQDLGDRYSVAINIAQPCSEQIQNAPNVAIRLTTSVSPNPPSQPPATCMPDWQCSEWSVCSPIGMQTRVCVVTNGCERVNAPEESRACTYVAEPPEECPPGTYQLYCPNENITPPGAGPNPAGTQTPWVVAIIAVIIILGAGIWYWRQ